MKLAKNIFHILTVASTSLTALGAMPGKSGVYVALVSSFISLALHAIAAMYPQVAVDEASGK